METLRQLYRLDWQKLPYRALPHGLTGLAALVAGALLIFDTVVLGTPQLLSSPLLYVYVMASGANAIAGYLISNRAPKASRPAFQFMAAYQIFLAYFAWRFSPLALNGNPVVRIFDFVFASIGIFGVVAFTGTALTWPDAKEACAVASGSAALMLLTGYPIQLALEGEAWWNCVQNEYAMQGVGLAGFVYVPTCWTFSMIGFAATLRHRHIIGTNVFAFGSILAIFGVLVTAVLLQEANLPIVTTQKLYIPCPARAPWQVRLRDALDTDVPVRALLKSIRNATGWN